jgi:hypothetical protein
MKTLLLILSAGLLIFTVDLRGQTNQARLFLPFLDKESQSNVVVSLGFNAEQPCPLEYTNVLSNTNLFTPEERESIEQAFVKYQDVTTNSGPSGSVLTDLYKTNFTVIAMNQKVEIDQWVARFRYTNSDAYETIYFGVGGIGAEYRNKVSDGYNADLTCVGSGSLLQYFEVKHNSLNGVKAAFNDGFPQGQIWDYKLANFSNSRLTEYRQYTNGMVIGKYLMWDTKNGNLRVEAKFKEPYDWNKHQLHFQ